MSKVCFRLVADGKQMKEVCLPLMYDPYWWLKHPDPESGGDIERWKGEDIAILGAIADMAEALSHPALKAGFRQIIHGAIDEVNRGMPAGVVVHLESQGMRRE